MFSYFSLTNEQKAGKQKASVHVSLKCTHKTDALFTSLLYGYGFLQFFYSTHLALVFNEKWQFNKNSNMRTESTCAVINKCKSEMQVQCTLMFQWNFRPCYDYVHTQSVPLKSLLKVCDY